ncbi:hypothetical protein EJ04DRAFT_564088 [Polyplosphaeria fusca]|uniref:Uncharacterized protein n=1 Tax=Polyplosphaeria fusca TaxID=682080 RepID=A0A9P4V2V9_9PLEO|nr:hypothetical protein EJ04DRAFT_564088 [Polyplosphaeria fusca]
MSTTLGAMEPAATPVSSSSRILQLPREVRDLILDSLLNQGVVRVKSAVAEEPLFDLPYQTTHFRHQVRDLCFVLRRPCHARSTFSLPLNHIFSGYSSTGHVKVPFTYQASDQQGVHIPQLHLQVMVVCRQLYAEAREIFYGRNIFRFDSDLRIPSALRFLEDRPLESLKHIKSMELALTEDECPPEDATDVFDRDETSGERSMKLRYAYGHFTQLCAFLADRMQLRSLGILLETLERMRSRQRYPATVEDCIERESASPADVPSWIAPITRIRGLERVMFRSISRSGLLRRHAEIARLLRASVLAQSDPSVTPRRNHYDSDFVEMRLRLYSERFCEVDYPQGTDFALRCDSRNGTMESRACTFKMSINRADELKGEPRMISDVEQDEDQELWADYGYAVVACYSELQSA